MFCHVTLAMVITQHMLVMEARSESSERPILDLIKKCEQLESLEKVSPGSKCDVKKGFDNSNIGVTYIRWGRNACDGKHSQTVYTGQGGGGRYNHKGSGVNYLCLPNDPDNGKPLPSSSLYSYLYGAEYRIYSENKPSEIKSAVNENDVPCAVCLAKRKSTVLMIPGRKRCYPGWRKEYHGYLMSGNYNFDSASDYACVDTDMQTIPGGSPNKEGKLFYPVKTSCGSLKCPPYTDNSEVFCVVCTR